MNNISNQVAYLPTTREFPKEIDQLVTELSRAYIKTANAVNNRTVSIFTINRPVVTGENWFIAKNFRQQGIRQVYNLGAISAFPHNIPHGINISRIGGFVRIWGTFTDGSIWYPLPYVDVVDVTRQVNIIVNDKNIVINAGPGAHPVISSGTVVLEWIGLP